MTSFYSNGNAASMRQQEKLDSIEALKTVLKNLSDYNNEGECGLVVLLRLCEENYGWDRRRTLILLKRSLRSLKQHQDYDHPTELNDCFPTTTSSMYQCHGGRGPRRGPRRSSHSAVAATAYTNRPIHYHRSNDMEIDTTGGGNEVTNPAMQVERELCMLVEEECVL